MLLICDKRTLAEALAASCQAVPVSALAGALFCAGLKLGHASLQVAMLMGAR